MAFSFAKIKTHKKTPLEIIGTRICDLNIAAVPILCSKGTQVDKAPKSLEPNYVVHRNLFYDKILR